MDTHQSGEFLHCNTGTRPPMYNSPGSALVRFSLDNIISYRKKAANVPKIILLLVGHVHVGSESTDSSCSMLSTAYLFRALRVDADS